MATFLDEWARLLASPTEPFLKLDELCLRWYRLQTPYNYRPAYKLDPPFQKLHSFLHALSQAKGIPQGEDGRPVLCRLSCPTPDTDTYQELRKRAQCVDTYSQYDIRGDPFYFETPFESEMQEIVNAYSSSEDESGSDESESE